MTLQEQFERLMATAFPHFKRGSPSWVDMEQAFFAGCLVTHAEYAQEGPRPEWQRIRHMLSIHRQLGEFGDTLKMDQQKQKERGNGNN
jgi:hypothetical protein